MQPLQNLVSAPTFTAHTREESVHAQTYVQRAPHRSHLNVVGARFSGVRWMLLRIVIAALCAGAFAQSTLPALYAQTFNVTFPNGNTTLNTAPNTPATTQLTITDANPAAVVFLVLSSSNPALIPTNNITVVNGGATRTLTATPIGGQMGSSTIMMVASNIGGASVTLTFTVNVSSTVITGPPTISPIAVITTTQDVPVTVPITISDANVGSVRLTASSNDQSLVSNLNFSFSGSGTNRALTITPINGRTGSLTITIAATNQLGLTSSRDVLMNVTAPLTDIPVITAPLDLSTTPGSPVRVGFTVADMNLNTLQIFTATSNPAIVPENNIVLSGSGSVRVLDITPLPGQRGMVTIIISALNQNNRASRATFNITFISPTDAPLISGIPALRTSVNTPVSANFTVIDANPNGLQFSASSSNPSVIPISGISITGSGAQRRVTVTPAPGQVGTSTITLTATNQRGISANTSFTVTVLGPPVLSQIPTISTRRNTPADANFTVSDANPATVLLSVASSNQTLIPVNNIILSGNGSNRAITLTPATGQIGTATMTITATNELGLTSTMSFQFVVSNPQTPPTISAIGNLTTTVNAPVGASFTVGDANVNTVTVTPSVSGNQTVITSNNIFFSGTGANRMIFIVPTTNQTGSAIVTLTATNQDGLTATTSFSVTVALPPQPPTIRPALTLVTPVNTPVSGEFIVGDRNLNSLTFTFSSANPGLIPNGNIIVSGFGTNRTITVIPALNRVGSAVITATVRNQDGLTSSVDFLVKVVGLPTISVIPNIVIAQNSTATVSFTVSDEDLSTIKLSATSFNATLFPNTPNNLLLGGTGTNRTITVTPALDQVGVASISVSLTNKYFFGATASFTVTVVPPPSVTGISDRDSVGERDTLVTYVNTPVSRNFTVNDANVNNLVYAANSSNKILIPVDNVSVTGSGTSHILTIVPAYPKTKDSVGSSLITLAISNGVAQRTKEIVVYVIPRPLTRPIQLSPYCGSTTGTLLPDSITFSWLAVPGARLYHLQVTPDPSFNFVQFDNKFIGATSATLEKFESQQTYYWRVRTQYGDRQGAWSEVCKFVTGNPFRDTTTFRPLSPFKARNDDGVSQTQDAAGTASAPNALRLYPNVPNPFNGTTRIEYDLPEATFVELSVVDGLGRTVANLVRTTVNAGKHAVEFDAKGLPSGAYSYILRTPNHVLREQMLIQK